MSQVNKYDASHALNAVTSVAESVLDVLARKMSVEASVYATDKQAENIRHTNTTNLQIAEMKRDLERDLTYYRGNLELVLKEMGINADRALENLKHLNLKDRMELEKELTKEIENLKHSNFLDRIATEFQNQLVLAEFDADEAMRRTITQALSGIMARAHTTLSGAAKMAAFELVNTLSDELYNSWQRNRNNGALGKYGKVVLPDKTLYTIGGNRNVEENKPGWESREEVKPGIWKQEERKPKAQHTMGGRGFKAEPSYKTH